MAKAELCVITSDERGYVFDRVGLLLYPSISRFINLFGLSVTYNNVMNGFG